MLKKPYLNYNFLKNIYFFVLDNYNQFISDVRKWSKGNVITYAKDRLEDKQFPKSKELIYLIIAAFVEEKIDSLLNQYENSEASIVAEVVKDLREK